MTDLTEIFGEPIAVYTMGQALSDGTLVDAGDIANELFAVPVILTATAWADCAAWTEEDSDRTGAHGQSETGRLWDVIWMTWCSRNQLARKGTAHVQLYRIPRDGQRAAEPESELVDLTASLATHDDGSPVIVIGFPEED